MAIIVIAANEGFVRKNIIPYNIVIKEQKIMIVPGIIVEQVKKIEKPVLAEAINGKSINSPKVQQYIKWHNDFSSLEFEKIEQIKKTEKKISRPMLVGNSNHELKGFEIENKKYAFDLIACDRETDSCEFKVNGIRTGKIHLNKDDGPIAFNIDENYKVKVNSIKYNICDPDVPICDKRYEAYDLVELEVVRE
ncbi:hypothetical protein KY366_03130 [Candidatus Woesearchaeota archaeon]|nr:hypothetical protein [Candidatus Woesearchaeota archaeon]